MEPQQPRRFDVQLRLTERVIATGVTGERIVEMARERGSINLCVRESGKSDDNWVNAFTWLNNHGVHEIR